ncbi:carbohydrate-binding family 9-like protein [Lachnospiraceae bacterium LCP25S3_G4]
MNYTIKLMRNPSELNTCHMFELTHLLWDTANIPRTYGRLGFVPEDGFYLEMTCEEPNPLRTFFLPEDPVYKDSAMEAFFRFAPDGTHLSPIYLNFEINANGAMLTGYGDSLNHRNPITELPTNPPICSAHIFKNFWNIALYIPLDLLTYIYGPLILTSGTSLSCNFYKISECPDIEHYASYAPIYSESPNFHLPYYFANATLK